MISRLVIEQVIKSQKERLTTADTGLLRKVSGYERLSSHAFILCGIRRCGKSTVLQQIHASTKTENIYLNFEDPRLAGFDLSDMNRLHDIGKEMKVKSYFFDEVQLVDQWEKFVRFRLDEGFRVYLTGSNATMLSTELGSKLTGRHISKELFPFSYAEFLAFTKRKPGKSSMMKYLEGGGFPEFIKTGLPDVLMQTFNDIIARDIAIRYNIKNSTILRQLAVWLVTNTGKPVSGNSLRKAFEIKSSSTIMEYLSYYADAYLFFFVPKFSYSNKVQIVNPKKVYCVDNGFIKSNSVSFSDDYGRLLENLVFTELRRKHKEIFYFNEGKECDFAIADKGKITELYQVCWQLNDNNTERELNGLIEAMEYFGIKTARIITANQQDSFNVSGKNILVEPFHLFFAA